MARQYPRIIALVSLLALLVALVPVAGISAQTADGIDFNGLFYGDNDYLDYIPLAQNPDRGYLYYYEDGTYLYLAVVVLPSVNDNVFGASKNGEPDRAYVFDAGWGQAHTAKALVQSDNLEIGFTCNGQSWNWFHGYAYQETAGGPWLSGPLDGSIGGGTWPADMEFKSSFAYNMNTSSWDYTLGGSRTTWDDWKSPDTPEPNGDNVITNEDGWGPDLTDATHQW